MLAHGAAPNQVDDGEQDDRADERDQDGGEVERAAVDRRAAEQEAADQRADDADDDIQDRTLLRVRSHDHAREPTDQRADQQPNDQVHGILHLHVTVMHPGIRCWKVMQSVCHDS